MSAARFSNFYRSDVNTARKVDIEYILAAVTVSMELALIANMTNMNIKSIYVNISWSVECRLRVGTVSCGEGRENEDRTGKLW